MAEGTLKGPYYRRLAATGAEMFMHPCSVCGDEHAPFGFGVELRKGRPGTWFCNQHKDQANAGKTEQGSAAQRVGTGIENAVAGLSEVGQIRPDDGRAKGPQNSLFD